MTASLSPKAALLATLLLLSPYGLAEQSQRAGNYEVHYVAFASTFLSPEMARKYDLIRGRNRALINISVLDANGRPVQASMRGTVKNLPGQVLQLEFAEVLEGDAVYYLAQTRFSDQELMRFDIQFVGPDGVKNQLKFDQKLYWED